MISEERLAAIAGRVRVFPGGDALIDSQVPAASDWEQSEMAQRLRSRYFADAGATHWEGCWRDHYRCAMAYIERLEELEREVRQALQLKTTPIRLPEWSPDRLRELADAEPGGLMACSPEILAELKEAAKTDPGVKAMLEAAGIKA